LERFLEGGLTGEERQQFETHLTGCRTCREETLTWQEITEGYSDWVQQHTGMSLKEPDWEEAARFAESVSTRLQTEHASARLPTRSVIRICLPVAAAAAAAVLVFVTAFILFSDTPDNRRPLLADVDVDAPPKKSKPIVPTDSSTRRPSDSQTPTGSRLTAPADSRLLTSIRHDTLALAPSGVLTVTGATPHETKIALTRGRAAFSVTPRTDSRFIVKAREVTVEVVGTRFEVAVEKDQSVTVTVAQGTVRVSYRGASALVNEGHRLRVSDGGISPEEAAGDDAIAALTNLLRDDGSETLKATKKEVSPAKAGARREPRDKAGMIPKDVNAWRQLIMDGREAAAMERINAYLKHYPTDTSARLLLATCLRKMGRYEDAVTAYQGVSEQVQNGVGNRACYLAGEISQTKLGDFHRAARFFDAYLKHAPMDAPNRAEARLRLAESLMMLGRRDRAMQELKRIVAEYGRAPIANRARILMDQHP
jgi:TolA-binding protein